MAVLKNAKVLFSNVINKDDFSQKYQIVVQLSEEQAADAEAAGLKVRTKEHEGKPQLQAVFKTKFKPRIVGQIASKDFDLEGAEIGRGSEVNIQYKFREWTNPSKQSGTSQDLVAVQIVDLKAVNGNEFEDEGGFGDDDGDI